MKIIMLAIALVGLATSLDAQTPTAPLAGLSFLIGNWSAGEGQVADTGGTVKGYSTITQEADGNVLLRRDHTDMFDRSGKPMGGFDQIMMIYPDGGTIHADYSDGTHVIHYVTGEVIAGNSVTFTSADQPNVPTFRLRYQLADPHTLTVAFQMAAPGSAAFHPIATGKLFKTK